MSKKEKLVSKTVFETKRELIYREYESLFEVYGRETGIVFNFRSWTITLLTAYYGFLLVSGIDSGILVFYLIPNFIIFTFLVIEAAERSVMLYLLNELRILEEIFLEKKKKSLKMKIIAYIPREIRDTEIKIGLKIRNFFTAFKTPQILSWYPVIILLNIVIVYLINSHNIESKNETPIQKIESIIINE